MSSEVFDLAVIGAGPAGMEASLAGASAGMHVAVIESQARPGGQYFRQPDVPSILPAISRQAVKLFTGLNGENPRLITGGLVWGIFPDEDGTGWEVKVQGVQHPTSLVARQLIVATGAYDFPFIFPGWTLPGIITAGAAQILVKSQGVLPGKRILVAGSGPLHFAASAVLAKAARKLGGEVVCIVQAPFSLAKAVRGVGSLWRQGKRIMEGLEYARTLVGARIPIYTGWGILAARGKNQIEQVVIGKLTPDWQPKPGHQRVFEVDTLVTGYGLLPNNHLGRSLGCQHYFDQHSGAWLPIRDHTFQTSIPGVYIVGDAAKISGAEAARLEGRLAGIAAARQAGFIPEHQGEKLIKQLHPKIQHQYRFGNYLQELFSPNLRYAKQLMTIAGEDTIACRCEDIRLNEIRQTIAAGATSPTEIKITTRCGMGNCQGRICETIMTWVLAASGRLRDPDQPEWGALNIRPPLVPLRVSDFRGLESNEP